MKRYKLGSKAAVMRRMADYAIRDQEALIDALTPTFRDPDEGAVSAIQDAKNCISDFKRIAKGSNVELTGSAQLKPSTKE